MTDFGLEEHIVVVTGAAGLLGREHCSAILNAGGHVIACDVDAKSLEALHQELGNQRMMLWPVDICDQERVRDEWQEIRPSVDIKLGLVNNAAVNPKAEGSRDGFTRLETFPISQWNREIEVGLTGALIMTQVIGDDMASRSHGTIVNISSDHGLIAPDQNLFGGPDSPRVKPVSYSVVKHGIIGLTRYTATYWAHRGVRANTLCPGGVYDGQDALFLRDFGYRVPMSRMARKDEYHGALVFLLSDASSYMTGGNLVVDGGRSIW